MIISHSKNSCHQPIVRHQENTRKSSLDKRKKKNNNLHFRFLCESTYNVPSKLDQPRETKILHITKWNRHFLQIRMDLALSRRCRYLLEDRASNSSPRRRDNRHASLGHSTCQGCSIGFILHNSFAENFPYSGPQPSTGPGKLQNLQSYSDLKQTSMSTVPHLLKSC